MVIWSTEDLQGSLSKNEGSASLLKPPLRREWRLYEFNKGLEYRISTSVCINVSELQ